MHIAVPLSESLMAVGRMAEDPRETGETALLNYSRLAFGSPLVVEYGWSDDGERYYIATPVDHAAGSALAGLMRTMYDGRWLPDVPRRGDMDGIIYDDEKPAVEIIKLEKDTIPRHTAAKTV